MLDKELWGDILWQGDASHATTVTCGHNGKLKPSFGKQILQRCSMHGPCSWIFQIEKHPFSDTRLSQSTTSSLSFNYFLDIIVRGCYYNDILLWGREDQQILFLNPKLEHEMLNFSHFLSCRVSTEHKIHRLGTTICSMIYIDFRSWHSEV